MKMTKLLLLAALICTTSLNAVTDSASTPKLENIELAKHAAQRILATKPTTLTGDIVRDLSAAGLAFGIQSGVLYATYVCFDKTMQPWAMLVPLFPILRYAIDKLIRKTDSVDKDLAALIAASSNINLKNLAKAGIDIKEIEDKVVSLSTKKERARWTTRALGAIIIVGFAGFFATIFNYQCQTCKRSGCVNEYKLKGHGENKITSPTLVASAIIIEILAIGVEMYTQSATVKKASRMKQLEGLKQLLAQAEVAAQ